MSKDHIECCYKSGCSGSVKGSSFGSVLSSDCSSRAGQPSNAWIRPKATVGTVVNGGTCRDDAPNDADKLCAPGYKCANIASNEGKCEVVEYVLMRRDYAVRYCDDND